MTIEEAKTVFLNRGYVEVEGGTIYDADKWREACVVISEWLEQEPKTGHWIEDEYEMEVRCSACGEENSECSKYCPNCGCRMVEPQETKPEISSFYGLRSYVRERSE